MISLPVAVTGVAPNVNELARILPSTTTPEEDKVIKLVLPLCPTLEPSITILSIVALPAVKSLFPMLISPKPLAIEPTVNGPTEVILVLPSLSPNLASAAVVVYLAVNPA